MGYNSEDSVKLYGISSKKRQILNPCPAEPSCILKKTMKIQISWLHKKPSDQDLQMQHCFHGGSEFTVLLQIRQLN